MLFSEIYGSYFAAVSEILTCAVRGGVTQAQIREIVARRAFGESALSIPAALREGRWPLLTPDGGTPLRHVPGMPLTLLEKRFMKALLLDPRIRLFDVKADGLEDVEPLFTPEMMVFFDRYSDSDPFGDEAYIRRFRTVLRAIREKELLEIAFVSGAGQPQRWRCRPVVLEYSEKDDKFRLAGACGGRRVTINLSRMTQCTVLGLANPAIPVPQMEMQELVLELRDERGAMERAMLHFSHFRKETERIGEDRYRLALYYAQEDETELLIRVLSFGPLARVVSPEHLVERVKGRLARQRALSAAAQEE